MSPYLAGGSVMRHGGVAHTLQGQPVRVGIECCHVLAAGIGAPRVNKLWVESFHGETHRSSCRSPRNRAPDGAFILCTVSPCFTPGTLISTENGQRPVETLKRGDCVVTRDNGLKRIVWVGRRDFSYHELIETDGLQPILIKAHAFGEGRPQRDMLVSPNHRFLISEGEEHLASAQLLIDHQRVKRAATLGVSYIHFLCNAHEVILANGAWSESFHPDDAVMKELAPEQRQEILLLFPEVATMGAARRFRPVRKIWDHLSRFET